MIVINAKDERPSDGVFIGRPSILSNPFIIDRDGDREEVILKFRKYFIEKFLYDLDYRQDALNAVMAKSKLVDKIKLVCFCKPNKCHGDVIKEVIEDYLTMDYNLFFIKYSRDNYNDNYDGVKYINVYSKGITQLGRYLSNLSDLALRHPTLGEFASMEGYWYYIKTGKQFEELKPMSGYMAKTYGKKLPYVENPNFKQELYEGLYFKVTQNNYLLELIMKNDLPYVHYYIYYGLQSYKVVVPSDKMYMETLVEVINEVKQKNK